SAQDNQSHKAQGQHQRRAGTQGAGVRIDLKTASKTIGQPVAHTSNQFGGGGTKCLQLSKQNQQVFGMQGKIGIGLDGGLATPLDQQHLHIVHLLAQHVFDGLAIHIVAGRYFHNVIAITQGDVVVDHGVAQHLGDSYAHFFFGVNNPVYADFGQNQMLGVGNGFGPDGGNPETFQVNHANQASLNISPNCNQNYVIIVQPQLFQSLAVSDISNDGTV